MATTPRRLIIASIGIALLGIFAAESFLRIAYREQLRLQAYPLIYEPSETLGYRYTPGTKGRICIPSICKDFEINERGFYGNNFSVDKPQETCRIAIVGSSLANGIWLDGTEDFAMKMQNWFGERELPVEVLNLSIDGRFRGAETLRMIETDAGRYEPDLVLVWLRPPFLSANARRENYRGYMIIYSGDDPLSRERARQDVDALHERWVLSSLYRMSYLVRASVRKYTQRAQGPEASALKTFVRKRYQSPEMRTIPLSLQRSMSLIEHTKEVAASRGETLVLMNFWTDPLLQEIARRVELPLIELGMGSIAESHEFDIHFVESTHQDIADRIVSGLQAEGLLTEEGGCNLTATPPEGAGPSPEGGAEKPDPEELPS